MLATPDNYIVITTPVGLIAVKDHGDSGEQVSISLFGRHEHIFILFLRLFYKNNSGNMYRKTIGPICRLKLDCIRFLNQSMR